MKKMYIENIIYVPVLIVAFLMVIIPDFIINIFNILIAALFMVNGVKHIIEYYVVKPTNSFINGLVLGLLNLLIGIMIVISDVSLVNLLPFMIALFAIFYAINNFAYLLTAKSLTDQRSISKLLRGMLGIAIGTLLIQNPDAFSSIFVRLTGVIIIMFIGYTNWQLYKLKTIPKVKRVKKKKS